MELRRNYNPRAKTQYLRNNLSLFSNRAEIQTSLETAQTQNEW